MHFDTSNPVVKLCSEGIELEGRGDADGAHLRYQEAWNISLTALDKFTAAHYLARTQGSTIEKLTWDKIALAQALQVEEISMLAYFPSLYLNIGKCYEDLGNRRLAGVQYGAARQFMAYLPKDGYGEMIGKGISAGEGRMLVDHYRSSYSWPGVSVGQLYHALTEEVDQWWSTAFEGSATKQGDIFKVSFGPMVFKTIQVVALEKNHMVVWHVMDSLINLDMLQDKTEWVDTLIIWEMEEQHEGSHLRLVHLGLEPALGCYAICSDGWRQFTDSLSAFLLTGKGMPFRQNQ